MSNNSLQKVCIIILPLNYNEVENTISGNYEYIPNNVINIYNTLVRASILVDVLNLEYEFHSRNIEMPELNKHIEKYLEDRCYSHIIFPISVSESLNEFSNVNINLLKKIIDETNNFENMNIIFTGRVLNVKLLEESFSSNFTLFKTSYNEDYEIAKFIREEADLNLLPLEYGDKLNEQFQLDHVLSNRSEDGMIIIYGQKGCKFQCAFCERYIIWPSNNVYELNLDETMQIIEYYIEKHKRKHFMVLDPLFNSNRKYVQEFCERVKKYGIKWHCEVKAELLLTEDLHLMKEAGCFQILFGAESFDKTILKQYNKPLNFDKLLDVIEVCKELGIRHMLSFIGGLGKNISDAYNHIYGTSEFLVEQDIQQYVQCVPFFFYEGTRFYEANFSKDNVHIFPKHYHPYEIIYMIDFVTLFNNKCSGNYIELKDEKIYCYRELFEFMARHSCYNCLSPDVIFSLSKNTRYSQFLASYFLHIDRNSLVEYIKNFLDKIEKGTEVSLVDFKDNLRKFNTPQVTDYINSLGGHVALI